MGNGQSSISRAEFIDLQSTVSNVLKENKDLQSTVSNVLKENEDLQSTICNVLKENEDLKDAIREKDLWKQLQDISGHKKGSALVVAILVALLGCYGMKKLWSGRNGYCNLLPEPWRPIHETMTDDLKIKEDFKKEILKISPKTIARLNILLLGQTGSGKSSFVNACETALQGKGRICKPAVDGAMTSDSITSKLTSHRLEITTGDEAHDLPVQLFDCRGLSGDKGVQTEDIKKICNGHVKAGYLFNPDESIKPDDDKYRKDPQEKDKMHCIVYILAADEDGFVHGDVAKQLKEIRKLFRQDIPQLVLLTKIDRLGVNDITQTFSDKRVKERCEAAANFLQFSLNDVFPQSSYSDEVVPLSYKDLITLLNIKTIMERAAERVNKTRSSEDI